MAADREQMKSSGSVEGPKAPVKRPASASVNHAQAAAKTEETKTTGTETGRDRIKLNPKPIKDTMPAVPESKSIPLSGEHVTPASAAFVAGIKNQEFAPAIATQIIPDVVETEKPKASPFKKVSAPVKRDLSGESAKARKEKPVTEIKKDTVPPVARFSMLPEVQEEASPFKPAAPSAPDGLKPPVKRPKSASVNRAQAMKQQEEDAKASDASEAEKKETPRVARFTPYYEAPKDTGSPFKPASAVNDTKAPKAPIKRPASASVNRAATISALKDDKKKAPSATTSSTTASSSRGFNAAAAMKELRRMEEEEAVSAPEPQANTGTDGRKDGLDRFFGRFGRS